MWDTWLYYHQEQHFLFYLHEHSGPPFDGMSVAISNDGVHFEEVGPIITKRDDATWLGTGSIWRAGERFVLNFSESRGGVQAVYFAVSDDLLHWERLDDTYRCDPDPRWYDDTPSGRWDCIWSVPRAEGGFWGYLTARPWSQTPGRRYESVGAVASDDGLHWRAVAPPTIDWGDWPPMDVGEVGAIERIGDRYYLMLGYGEARLGNRHAADPLRVQQGMYTFVGERPEGPFHADTAAYRLLTSNARGPLMAYFTRFYRLPAEVLVNHHSIARSNACWMAPLKRAVIDDGGHLSLGYWPGNEAAKGARLSLDLGDVRPLWAEDAECPWRVEGDGLAVDTPHGGAAILLPGRFDLTQGVVLEGYVTAEAPAGRWSAAGLFIERHAAKRRGTALLAETRGQTEIGPLRGTRDGLDFLPDDVKPLGLTPGVRSHLRLLLRQSLAELYLDDRLVQCYALPEASTGRLGLVAESGHVRFEGLRAWGMDV